MFTEKASSYLLTEDLGEKINAFRHVGLKTPDPHSQFYMDIQDELAVSLQRAVGDEHPVIRIKMRELSDEILSRISEVWGDDVLIVSTCPEIGQPAKGSTVEVNRLVDKYGQGIGLGQRPGHPSLREQFRKIAEMARINNYSIVIAEDGMFKGETMMYVVRQLISVGANVAGVAAGFTFKEEPVLELSKLGVKVEIVRDFGPILDWVPDHDFLPFTPGCGKVLGATVGHRTYPFYDHQHASFCVPYIAPFGPVADWTSIPEQNIGLFSADCARLAIRVFEQLERMNNRKIFIRDIIHSRQRVSIPVSLDVVHGTNVDGLPGSDAQVTTFLAETL